MEPLLSTKCFIHLFIYLHLCQKQTANNRVLKSDSPFLKKKEKKKDEGKQGLQMMELLRIKTLRL